MGRNEMDDRLSAWQVAQARRTRRPDPLHFEPPLEVTMKSVKVPDYLRDCAFKAFYGGGGDCLGYWELWHGEGIVSWLARFDDSRLYIPMGNWHSRSSPNNSFWHLAVDAETLNDGRLFREAANELLRLEGLVLDD